jgi:hypothetical protein
MTGKFFIILVVLIIIGFGLFFAGFVVKKEIDFKLYAAQLGSEDVTTRTAAFEFLIKQDERGRNVIADFCRSRSNYDWGKPSGGLAAKITLAPIYYIRKRRFDDIENIEYIEGNYSFAIKNVSEALIKFVEYGKGQQGHISLDPHIGKYVRIISNFDPTINCNNVCIGRGEIINSNMAITSNNIRREVTAFEGYKLEKGIYFIQVECYLLKTGCSITNRICFAVLPEDEKTDK